MKKLTTFLILSLAVLRLNAQLDSCLVDNPDLFRKIELIMNDEVIKLDSDFKIYVFLNLDRLDLLPKRGNHILLPFKFPNDSIYRVIFIYKNYELVFDNVQGSNFNYDVDWKYNINTLGSDKKQDQDNSWIFEPKDSDGWIIHAKTWFFRKNPIDI